MPLISVVMPVYNRQAIVKHAINGILDQTFSDWELLIVDDGSSDNTLKECQKFAYNDHRIQIHAIPHTGIIGKVRNYGNQRARGELIVVQDSDDVSLPDRLDVLWQEYKNTKADVLYHSMYMIFRDIELDMITREFRPAFPFNKQKLIQAQYIPGQVAYTKKAVMKVPYNETMSTMDDWQILIELAMRKYRFHPINRALYEYWYSEDSVTLNTVDNGKRVKDAKKLMNILRKKYKVKINFVGQYIKDLTTGEILKDEVFH